MDIKVVREWTFDKDVTVRELAGKLSESLSELGRTDQKYSHILTVYDKEGYLKYISCYQDSGPIVCDKDQLYTPPCERTEYDWENDVLLETKGLEYELCEIIQEEE